MAFKNPDQLANSFVKKPFAYAHKLDDINDILSDFDEHEIDLDDGYSLYPTKNKVYGDDRDFNVEFDIMNGDEYIDTLGVYGTDFDEDYQRQLEEIIDNYKRGTK